MNLTRQVPWQRCTTSLPFPGLVGLAFASHGYDPGGQLIVDCLLPLPETE